MNIAQAKSIPLEHYLDRQGHRPAHARQGGRELWYRSPIRGDDDTPSFKVDTQKNVWFDHGLAKGGTIIDLVTEVCACNVRDALRHLESTGLYSPALSRPMTSRPSQPSRTSPRGSSTPSSTSSHPASTSAPASGRSASPAPGAPRLFDLGNDAAPAATDTGVETSARGAARRSDPAGEKEKEGGCDAHTAEPDLDNDSAGDAATKKLFEHAQTPSKLADMRAHYARHEDLNAWLLDRKP